MTATSNTNRFFLAFFRLMSKVAMPACVESMIWLSSVMRRGAVLFVPSTNFQPLSTSIDVLPSAEFNTWLTAAVHGTTPGDQVERLSHFASLGLIHWRSVTRTLAPST